MVRRNVDIFYSSVVTGSTEIDLRTEFNNTIYGKNPEIEKGQAGLLRRFRLEDGARIKCPCVDVVTGEPDREIRCPVCLAEGYLWDETSLDFYHARVGTETSATAQDVLQKAGLMNTETEVFYIPSTFDLTETDKIVLLQLNKDGTVVTPNRRLYLYRIAELRPMRLDSGRLEFWKAYVYEDNNKFI